MRKKNFIVGQLQLVEATEPKAERWDINFINERIESYGVDSLVDAEIVSALTNIKLDKVREAIENFSLMELGKYAESLHLTKIQHRKLQLLTLFYKRMQLASYKEKALLDSSSKAGAYAVNLFIDKAYEAFYLISLDNQNRVNHASQVHEGTLNESPVYPRIIIETALRYRANSVILAHNHPGGSLRPSSADITATKNIKQALDTIQIKLIDHIVVGENNFFSFAEQGLL